MLMGLCGMSQCVCEREKMYACVNDSEQKQARESVEEDQLVLSSMSQCVCVCVRACESMCVHESKQKQTREPFEEDQLYVCDGFWHESVCVCVFV